MNNEEQQAITLFMLKHGMRVRRDADGRIFYVISDIDTEAMKHDATGWEEAQKIVSQNT